jgi:beta-aspartyl-peptidase (threonine type)
MRNYQKSREVEKMPINLIVHGGAGEFDEARRPKAVAACRRAVESVWSKLQQGASALDAVEEAVRVLESDPVLNAGYGCVLNRDGYPELDAMIMDGRTYKFGAVAAVRRIEHPVSLARWVLERTDHHLLAGEGADRFAQEQGMPLIDPQKLIAEYRRKRKPQLQQHQQQTDPYQQQQQQQQDQKDTVGAVALDHYGNIAVAVSTGGLDGKLPGRVGDSPIAGAGGYADNAYGGACSTGTGEGIMRSLLTFRAVGFLENGLDVQTAADRAIAIFTERFQGEGGLIMLDKNGNVGISHNTPTMPVAYMIGSEIYAQLALPDR